MSVESYDMQEYNTLYQSLREVLKPARKWFNDVQRFESALGLCIEDVGGDTSIWKSDVYLVPYTYTHPVYAEMLHERHPNTNRLDIHEIQSFTDKDVQEWIARVKERVDQYAIAAISDDMLSELDSNSDVGIIVHKTGGQLFPIIYSETSDIMLQIVPEQTIVLLSQYTLAKKDKIETALYWNLKGIISQYESRMSRTKEPEYFMYYQPIPKDGSMSDHYGIFTWRDTIPLKDTHELTKYIRLMFKKHAKCFIVP